MIKKQLFLAVLALGITHAQESKKENWIQLFNGKDLTGWTPKFKGSDLGVNYKDTFKVQDGLLTIDANARAQVRGALNAEELDGVPSAPSAFERPTRLLACNVFPLASL